MSDKKTIFGQYVAQGGKDGTDKSTVTSSTPAEDNRSESIKPAPEVK